MLDNKLQPEEKNGFPSFFLISLTDIVSADIHLVPIPLIPTLVVVLPSESLKLKLLSDDDEFSSNIPVTVAESVPEITF